MVWIGFLQLQLVTLLVQGLVFPRQWPVALQSTKKRNVPLAVLIDGGIFIVRGFQILINIVDYLTPPDALRLSQCVKYMPLIVIRLEPETCLLNAINLMLDAVVFGVVQNFQLPHELIAGVNSDAKEGVWCVAAVLPWLSGVFLGVFRCVALWDDFCELQINVDVRQSVVGAAACSIVVQVHGRVSLRPFAGSAFWVCKGGG